MSAISARGEMTLAYLPRYAPALNLDEHVWNPAKRTLGKFFIESQDDMKRLIL